MKKIITIVIDDDIQEMVHTCQDDREALEHLKVAYTELLNELLNERLD